MAGEPNCPATSPAQRLPTRILDLDLRDGTQDLCLHEPHSEFGVYATLSHCWGSGDKPFMTELATLKKRRKRISFLDLPLSFQDAVKICRKLEIRYLWIDTLCIIQDSFKDWASESAQMARIYKDGVLMIAFSDYRDCHQPVLTQRPELLTCELGKNLNGVYMQSSFARAAGDSNRYFPSLLNEWPSYILGLSSQLGRRAWAFQERILAPRILHYTSQQLIWECASQTLSENGINSHTRDHTIPSIQDTRSKNEFYRYWREILQRYTECSLTFPSDKFPALSGVASEVQKRIDDVYVAGLWKGDLPLGLMWAPARSTLPVAEYRAPSWSWASFEGKIEHKHWIQAEDQTAHAHDMLFLGYHTNTTTSDPFGKIDSASLLVQAHCLDINYIHLTSDSGVASTQFILHSDSGDQALTDALLDFRFDDPFRKAVEGRYTLLQLARWKPRHFGQVSQLFIQGMVVELVDVPEPATGHPSGSKRRSWGISSYKRLSTTVVEKLGRSHTPPPEKNNGYKRVGLARISEQLDEKTEWDVRTLTLV